MQLLEDREKFLSVGDGGNLFDFAKSRPKDPLRLVSQLCLIRARSRNSDERNDESKYKGVGWLLFEVYVDKVQNAIFEMRRFTLGIDI